MTLETTDPGRAVTRAELDAAIKGVRRDAAQAIAKAKAEAVEAALKKGEEADALKDQDRRLLPTRILLALVPTLPALFAAWMATRGVAVDDATVQAVADAVRVELAAGSQ